MTLPPGLPVRLASWRFLESVRNGAPWDQARETALGTLQGPDRNLAYEIAAGVSRHRGTLDDTLGPLLDRPWSRVDPSVQTILRLGAYQLLYLDRVPAHAAVDTAVALSRHCGKDRAAGLINAVLRRLGRDPHALRAPDRTHPQWLVDRWRARFGLEQLERLLRWNDTIPPIVVQAARWSQEALAERWQEAGIDFRPAPLGLGFIPGDRDPRGLPGFAEGGFIVQDPAQAMVVRFAGIRPGGTVYDPCAAPGGKTIAAGRVAGIVVAGDRDASRLGRLQETVLRSGSGNIRLVRSDAGAPPLNSVEMVLLDVPCLGTGTFARHPDARWRASPTALRHLVEQGGKFLRSSADLIRNGGLLCFSTCSLEPEENEEQVDAFLADHPGFTRDPLDGLPPDLMTPRGDLALYPHLHGVDGAYAARLRRTT